MLKYCTDGSSSAFTIYYISFASWVGLIALNLKLNWNPFCWFISLEVFFIIILSWNWSQNYRLRKFTFRIPLPDYYASKFQIIKVKSRFLDFRLNEVIRKEKYTLYFSDLFCHRLPIIHPRVERYLFVYIEINAFSTYQNFYSWRIYQMTNTHSFSFFFSKRDCFKDIQSIALRT